MVALFLVRASMMGWVLTVAGLGIWQAVTGGRAVRWPLWFTLMTFVLAMAVPVGWRASGRPHELKPLLTMASFLQVMMSTLMASVDRDFLPVAVLAGMCLVVSLFMPPSRVDPQCGD